MIRRDRKPSPEISIHGPSINGEGPATSVISNELALQLYERGVRQRRAPEPVMLDEHRNINSYDFRGAMAAGSVLEGLPHEDGSLLPVTPEAMRKHMDAALADIRNAGRKRLANDFVKGYQRMTAAFVNDQEPKPDHLA